MVDRAVLQIRTRPNYINDIEKLVAIAKLLENNPAMKRTTAIRSIGIEDPTTIRRLRKKLTSTQTQRNTPTSDTEALEERITALKVISQKQTHKVRSRQAGQKKTKVEDRKPTTQKTKGSETQELTDQHTPKVQKPDLMSCLLTANLAASQALVQMQFKLLSFAFQASPLACYLRNQELIRLTLQNIKLS